MLENKDHFTVKEFEAAGATVNAGFVMELIAMGAFGKYATAEDANWKTDQSVIGLVQFSHWPALEHRFSTGISDDVSDWSKCNFEDKCEAQVKRTAIGAFRPPFMPVHTKIDT